MTCVVLLSCLHLAALAQEAAHTLTNADIINVAKSGVGEQTIVLMIQKAVPKFDTSPEAVIELKKAGISDVVLNAILSVPPNIASIATSQQACEKSLDATLAAIGVPEKVLAANSTRWRAAIVVNSASGRSQFTMQKVTVFPSNGYVLREDSFGRSTKMVYTPEFNYLVSGKVTTAIPPSTLRELQSGMKLEPLFIAQHRNQYTCISEGIEQIGDLRTDKLRIAGNGLESVWNIDPSKGRLVRTTVVTAADRSMTDLSDWRLVDGIYVPFARHNTVGAVTTDMAVNEYQVNPVVDASLFQMPADRIAPALTLKVLQSESVPYVVQRNGGISTSCNISGTTNTSISATQLGNATYGTASSTPNLQMNCRSSDSTIRWTHVLNAMFAEASDGNAYIIACDRAWRWSKCVPLRAGETFLAQLTDKGFLVQSFNGKAKEQDVIYSVLQSKSLQK
jgi:hypothetical protein